MIPAKCIHTFSSRARLAVLFAVAMLSLGYAYAKGAYILYSFCTQANCTDGAKPVGGLVADAGGNFYGATASGGAHGQGTVYRLAPDGTETVLYSFTGGTDGGAPTGALVFDSQGNLYGNAGAGGAKGQGVVFKLAPDGTETPLYAFGGGEDGGPPYGSLIIDSSGNLYGVGGGGLQRCFGGCGAIFEVASNAVETVLYSFCTEANCTDGELPNGELVADRRGNLYGTTQFGGDNGIIAAGTLFKVAATGKEKVLWSFCARSGCSDGEFPLSGLIRDKSGNLYGTTNYGGNPVGTVFRLAPDGTETVLHGFTGYPDGGNPAARPVADNHGNLYGTTSEYGAKCGVFGGCGTVYKVAQDGSFTMLHALGRVLRGAGDLLETHGNLYGTSTYGGAHRGGTVFTLRK